MADGKVTLTLEEAESVLDVTQRGENEALLGRVHSFMTRNDGGTTALFGADHDLQDVLSILASAKRIEVTGEIARGMKHGVAVVGENGVPIFLATIEEELAALLKRKGVS